MRIKWLHLSDIHFNYQNYASHNLREDFIKRIEALSQGEPFTHLFLTGDILFRNAVANSETIDFINKLIKVLNIPLENVILVPGNHDHARQTTIEQLSLLPNNTDASIDSVDQDFCATCLGAFANFDSVYSAIFGSSYYLQYENPHIIIQTPSLSIIKLNTAWLDIDSKQESTLRVGSRKLQLLLSASKEIEKTINLAVGHHPLEDFSDSERTRILDLFQRYNIGLYFCGHRHCPDIKVHRSYDVIEFIAPGGFNDGYSIGGYIWGVIDTDCDFYKAEVYNWHKGKWGIDSSIAETDEHGLYYFNTSRYSNKTDIVAIDCKTMGGHIPKRKLEESLGVTNFDTHVYCGPPDNPNGYNEDTIQDFAKTILHLAEDGKNVHLYPLAPIPMLLSLGFSLQKNARIIIHQYDRNTDKWVLSEKAQSINISFNEVPCINPILAVSISTSFLIDKSLIAEVMKQKQYDLLEIKTDHIAPGYPLYSDDVLNIAKAIGDRLNNYVSFYKEIHLFAAIPAGLAVEFGRNLLASVYKNVFTYQLVNGCYEQDLIINKTVVQTTSVHHAPAILLTSTNIINIPILGRIPCGPVKEALVENEKCFPMLESVLDNGEYYILIASGDSMINAGIDDGDYILVKQQNTANNGEIVVALVEGETTIKRIHYDDESKKIMLCPENDKYKSTPYDHIDIQGIAVKVIKSL